MGDDRGPLPTGQQLPLAAVSSTQSTREALIESLQAILASPGDTGRALDAKARAAWALAQLLQDEVPDPDALPDAPLLTPREREAMKAAMIWSFDPGLWDKEMRDVVLKLALYSEEELEVEIARGRPRRRRAR